MNSPYEILFETVRIGPVIAPNRFYQVPQCNGFGYRMPRDGVVLVSNRPPQ